MGSTPLLRAVLCPNIPCSRPRPRLPRRDTRQDKERPLFRVQQNTGGNSSVCLGDDRVTYSPAKDEALKSARHPELQRVGCNNSRSRLANGGPGLAVCTVHTLC